MDWASLAPRATRLAAKGKRFGEETYVREALADVEDAFGDSAATFAADHALLLFKPEAIVARTADRLLEAILEARFAPVAAGSVTLDRHLVRTMWRYVLNQSSLDRLDLVDRSHTATPCLLVLVRDESADPLPASVRLCALRGPSDPDRRRPGQLRYGLEPRNRLLNHLHVAEEPADVLREIGILLDRRERRAIVDRALRRADATADTTRVLRDLYADAPTHDLDVEASTRRMRAALSDAAGEDAASEVAAWLPDWSRVRRALEPHLASLDVWDYISVGAHYLRPDVPGGVRLLESATPELWLARP